MSDYPDDYRRDTPHEREFQILETMSAAKTAHGLTRGREYEIVIKGYSIISSDPLDGSWDYEVRVDDQETWKSVHNLDTPQLDEVFPLKNNKWEYLIDREL